MIRINEDLCTGCGACVSDCISGVLSITQGKAHVCDECLQCGHCIAICPQAAPSISVYSDELIEYHSETFDIPTQNMLNTIKFRRSVRQFKEQLLLMRQRIPLRQRMLRRAVLCSSRTA